MRDFNYFVQKIPTNIYNQAKSVFSKHMAIFVPERYVIEKKMDVEEYHFVLFFDTPPVATIGQKQYQFKKGSLLCLVPGDDILVHPTDTFSPARYLTVCVLPEFMINIYRELGGIGTPTFRTLNHQYSHFLIDALDALIHEVINYSGSNLLMLASLENRIAIQLLRDAKAVPHLRYGLQQRAEEIIDKACRYIETYYTSNITTKDISDAIFISPSYLQKIFPKFVGKTPHQYILECRHYKARELLAMTQLSMEEITRQCGFVNRSHFSTTFKRFEGASPLAYRKTISCKNKDGI